MNFQKPDLHRPFIRTFALVFALSLAALSLPTARAASEKPNIVFIMVDDLGYGDLSCYGAPDLQTPNIDRLFASGLRFDHFYANCPVCSPTRASFLTGLYPDNAGVPGVIRTPLPGKPVSWGKLREDVPLIPAVLKPAGYHSALVGKWHLGLEKPDRPHDRGFDLFHGFLGDMMDDYYKHLRFGQHYMRRNDEPIHPEGHATDLFTTWAQDYITDRTKKAPDQPFFLFLAYNAPHTPIQPPQDWLEKVQKREAGITEKRAKLVALIEHLDHGVGQVIDTIDDLGIREDTLIVFTSDNGGQVNVGARNAPLRGGKQEMWEGGIRVGTCASWPGKIEAGSRTDHQSLTMDFFPTLAEIAGADVPTHLDGRSFLPVLLGETFTEETDRQMVWVRLEGNRKYGGLPYHAIQRAGWKLTRNTPFEPYQLFHLAEDPAEENPIPSEKAPKKYSELFDSLMLHINHAGKYRWQRDKP